VPLPLALLLAFALVQGLAWAAFTLPLHGPDEPAHVAYAQHLAETGKAPRTTGGDGPVSTELARAQYEINLRPIFGHAEARPTWSAVEPVAAQLDRIPDAQRKNGSGPNAVAHNPPLYYAYEAVAYRLSPDRSLFARLFAMRAASVLLYVLTVWLVWLIAAEAFTRPSLRFLATAVVALHPKLASVAGSVNPDTLLTAVATGFLLAGLRLLRRGPSVGRVAAVAALAGLGALTHGRGLFLVPAAVVVLGIAAVRTRPALGRLLRSAAPAAAILLACLAGAYLWTRSSSGGAFGGELGRAAGGVPFDPRQFLSYVWQFYLPRMSFMDPSIGGDYGYREMFIDSFFGGFANFEVNLPRSVYDLLEIGVFLGLVVGLYTAAILRPRRLLERWPAVAFAAATFLALMALLHISSYRDLQVGGDPLITGRYLLPCIALFGVAIAWVVGALPRRLRAPAAATVLGGFVAIDVMAFLVNAQRFYG
jgi:4-amino-4-deoxy-L-arabinose transferase-like glycosyltransferase